MKVIYKKPVIDTIWSELVKASCSNKVIDRIIISKQEAMQLSEELGITIDLKTDKVFVLYGVTIQVE